ncbi:MAG: metallophosphoesterase [Desulfobacterales bacterium]|nr:metallophosphoesterase [Desulfobacterales bacterium]
MIHLSLSCTARTSFLFENDPDALGLAEKQIPYPDTDFFVVSDTHLYDTRLGTEGQAFQDYLDNDRKLLVLSDEIIGTALAGIAKQSADFVLVCGDLTKDGEMVCHKGMARHLKKLTDAGKQVFVVPGNHDVANTEAVRFEGGNTHAVPAAGPREFEAIYKNFGYGRALDTDPHSLSYVAEPVDGMWLLALDSCRWQENVKGHHPLVSGAFSKETLVWIEQQLIKTKQNDKAVIVAMHHGAMEHYPANERFYDEYVIKDHKRFTELLAAYHVPLVFTGHFHAQDITLKKIGDRPVFDIETGSLVTAPCPHRKIELRNGNTARITSTAIESIPSMGDAFGPYAREYVFKGTQKLADTALAKYYVTPEQSELINSQVAAAYTAHLRGDEILPPKAIDPTGFGYWLRVVSWMQEDLIQGWWTDLPPRDNNLVLKLDTGEVASA